MARRRSRRLSFSAVTEIKRPLSVSEYYHASIGSSGSTLEPPRHIVCVLEGVSGPDFCEATWRAALDKASAANVGSRLRLSGDGWRSRWHSDGSAPRLRVVESSDWDGRSGAGAEFINDTPLSLSAGTTAELLIVRTTPRGMLVILRVHHAVMDGSGCQFFLQEIFRAMRDEPPLGSNVDFSDADLITHLGVRRSSSRHVKTAGLTGEPQGQQIGDDWRRIDLQTTPSFILARIAAAMAAFVHQRSSLPALIAVPVDLRRHMPELRSTTNFTGMLLVPLKPGEGVEAFRTSLRNMLAERMDAYLPGRLSALKLLPMSWLDRMLSRKVSNYRKRTPVETAVISNLRVIDPQVYECAQFRFSNLYVIPLAGSFFCILSGLGQRLQLSINLPRVFATGGRTDLFVEHLHRHLRETEPLYGGAETPTA